MSKLRIRNGPYAGREKNLVDDAVVIGRDVEAGIQILDRSASRFHAEVFPVGGMFFVKDLASKNGTYVNGEILEDEELLREGDVIKIGTSELVFETGAAVNEGDSDEPLAYSDDAELLSNTLEFRVDDLSDIEDEEIQATATREDARALQMLYQVGKIISNDNATDKAPTKVLDYLIATMPSDNALVFIADRASGKLVPKLVRTSDEHPNPVICRTLIRRAMMENRAVLSANAMEDAGFNRRDSAVIKGIGSVMCVPLGAGQARGVLYLSRMLGQDPFAQRDLELLSGCAVPLGLAFQAVDERQSNRLHRWNTVMALVRTMESRVDCLGSGERCAQAARALAEAIGVTQASWHRVRLAGLLHHLPMLIGAPAEKALTHLDSLTDFEDVLPLIRGCQQGRRATDADMEHDIEIRVLQVAAKFEATMMEHPESDAAQNIARLAGNKDLDSELVEALKGCHLQGTLFGQPPSSAP